MAAEFSLGMFKKMVSSGGYLRIGGKQVIKLTDVTSVVIANKRVVINGAKEPLAVIKGLPAKRAFAAMDFINTERAEVQAMAEKVTKTKKPVKSSPIKYLLLFVVILLILLAVVYFM